MEPQAEITRLIREWQGGNRTAERAVFEALYRTLHRIALQCVRTERLNQTLGPTALVHEAYLRFSRSQPLEISDRGHFLALAARVMRRILVDRARARRANKRGGELSRVDEADEIVGLGRDADRILAVDTALKKLGKSSPRQEKLVELHWFGGYTMDESADILGISARTARREWQAARVRLRGAIDGTASAC
jgi:RNA polymerase sigma factor (TIGR02999 family)